MWKVPQLVPILAIFILRQPCQHEIVVVPSVFKQAERQLDLEVEPVISWWYRQDNEMPLQLIILNGGAPLDISSIIKARVEMIDGNVHIKRHSRDTLTPPLEELANGSIEPELTYSRCGDMQVIAAVGTRVPQHLFASSFLGDLGWWQISS